MQGKNNRQQKLLKFEKAKVKLKVKGSKQLLKGLNIRSLKYYRCASFQVKKNHNLRTVEISG